jgi:hypothetical protein
VRCRMPRSQKMLGYRIDGPTNFRKPPQELFQQSYADAWLWCVRFGRTAGTHAFIDL